MENLLNQLDDIFKWQVINSLVGKYARRSEITKIIESFHISYDIRKHTEMKAKFAMIFPNAIASIRDGTPIEAISRFNELKGKDPIIIIPNHSSNLDAPLINYYLDQLGLLPVNIAGANLRGRKADLLRRVNVLFYERNLSKLEKLNKRAYLPCMNNYIQRVLDARINVLMFIEGGRSYSGILNEKGVGDNKDGGKGSGTLVSHIHKFLKKNPRDYQVYIAPASINYVWVGEDSELIGNFNEGTTMPPVDLMVNCAELEKRLAGYEESRIVIRLGMPLALDEYIEKVETGGGSLQLELVKAIAKERIHFAHQIAAFSLLHGIDFGVVCDKLIGKGMVLDQEFYDDGTLCPDEAMVKGVDRLASRRIITPDLGIIDENLLRFYANQTVYEKYNS